MTAPRALSVRKRVIFSGVTLLASSAAVLLAGEIALRLLVPADPPALPPGRSMADLLAESARTEVTRVTQGHFMGIVQPSPDQGLVYELKPGRQWISENAAVRINSQGFRGGELPGPKDKGVLRVVGVGDSVMFGWGVGEDETYMRRLEASLAVPDRRVEVLNLAVPGYNSAQEAIVVRTKVMPLSPDLLLVGYVLNDAEPVLFRDAERVHPFVSSIRILELARDLIDERIPRRHQGHDAMAAALDEIGRLARDRQLPVVFFIYPNVVRGENPEIPRRVALANGFTCVDLYAAFKTYYGATGRSFRDVSLSPTDAHPNPEGHRLIAEALAPVVRAALAQ